VQILRYNHQVVEPNDIQEPGFRYQDSGNFLIPKNLFLNPDNEVQSKVEQGAEQGAENFLAPES
jgi:hypothetical protein